MNGQFDIFLFLVGLREEIFKYFISEIVRGNWGGKKADVLKSVLSFPLGKRIDLIIF